MKKSVDKLVEHWLPLLEIPVSIKFIQQQLATHPHYPSLLSITDLLDELDIPNASVIVDKQKLKELPTPFLAHAAVNGGEFLLVVDANDLIKNNPHFLDEWDGIIVMAEKPAVINHADNNTLLAKEKRNKISAWVVITLILAFSIIAIAFNATLLYASLLITSLIGLGIAVLIVQHEMGIENELTEQLCGLDKHTDCNAVLNAKQLTTFKWLQWADMTIIWFSCLVLWLIAAAYTETVSGVMSILAIIGCFTMVVTFLSIYYQWRVVKKWCTLCLLTVAILWVQFALLIPNTIAINVATINEKTVAFSGSLFWLIAASWLLLIKPALLDNKQLSNKNNSLQLFKNNPEVFRALLLQQKKIGMVSFEYDLQLGNPQASIQIMVACNLFCKPCAVVHEILHQLVEKNDIGFTVRFAIRASNKEDIRTMAITHLLQHIIEQGGNNNYKRTVLYNWYKHMDFEKFTNQYPVYEKVDVTKTLHEHEAWATAINIMFTPTIFVNGYQMPKQYQPNELKELLKWYEEINIAESKSSRINN